MNRRPADRSTIERLIGHSERIIRDYEQLLGNVETAKAQFDAISDNGASSLESLRLILEVLSGGVAGMHECAIALCGLLQTDSVYEKRYQMRMINLSQYEWCRYLVGRDGKGVFVQLCKLFSDCRDNDTTDHLQDIGNRIRTLSSACNVCLRNVTAHYDSPSKIYCELVKLNDEDVYVRRIGSQMEIADKIMSFINAVLDAICFRISAGAETSAQSAATEAELRSLVNDRVVEQLRQRSDLRKSVAGSLAAGWKQIESLRKNCDKNERCIEWSRCRGVNPERLRNLRSLIIFDWTIAFMFLDCACVMNSYFNASTRIARSVCLHRIYMLETAMLTHLYGYDEEHRRKSIWQGIKNLAEFAAHPASPEIERRLQECTSLLDCDRRNLYTHYREDDSSNIAERWRDFRDMDHVEELFRLQKLLVLCKDIRSYACSLLTEMAKTEKAKTQEGRRRMEDTVSKIRNIGITSGSRELTDAAETIQDLLEKFGFGSGGH